MLRRIDRHVERHICVSRSVAEVAEVRGKLSAERSVVIPNGIQTARDGESPPANLAPFGVPGDRQVITFVGRLHRQKGIDWLLQIMPDVFAALPLHDLLIVGVGPQQQRLKRLANSLGISHRVHFAGWCDNVAGVLKASRLFVMPSRWEGMPNALLEAMASGLPVVATDVEGVTELLGETPEQVVPAHDAEAFKRKVIRWCGEPAAAARLGSENRRIAQQCFSLERMIARYQQLYESLD
jgi:starch synthase (maltosyl-transferring)